ncbi:MAG: hypothetical protein IKZ19_05935 [Clostridia bacterium]|nr:hypothetical protein [Clostridia bacterium]
MKKTVLAFALCIVMLCAICVPAFAAGEGMTVYVTIANGDLCIAHMPVEVSDVDGDGNLTINDALYLAHETYYKGGADKGYSSFVGDYGLAISRLWGEDRGTGYGYYINDMSAFSLSDPVAKGDKIVAFVYTDTVGYSDAYCFFDKSYIEAASGEKVALTLSCAGYDENWNPVTLPVANAVITVGGEKTDCVTDENGCVEIVFESKKDVVVSAVSDTAVLVPPVCAAVVDGADDGGFNWTFILIIAAVALVGGFIMRNAFKAKKK